MPSASHTTASPSIVVDDARSDRLTADCNGCHQAASHRFISIRRPGVLPYSNQSFAPPPRR